MTEPIFHLAEPIDWAGSDICNPPSVDEEGLVHCSTADQLPGVAHDRFGDHNGLIPLTIDPERLEADRLVYEDLDMPMMTAAMAPAMGPPGVNRMGDGSLRSGPAF